MSCNEAVLLAGNFLSADGGSRSVLEDLAHRLQSARYRTICISRYRNGWLRGSHFVLASLLHRHKYGLGVVDLYSGRAFYWGEALSLILRLTRCPFILTLHGGGLPEFAQRHATRVKACLERADAVTVPSRYLLEQMRPYRDNLCLLPNPLETSRYPFRLRRHPRARLVWLRAFHSIYNPTLAAQTLARLRPALPEISLTMIGDERDGSMRRTKDTAALAGLLDCISFPGGVPNSEVPDWLNRGDIFLNTTNFDNTPVSVLEAMACGLCVISTNVGGIPYLLENEKDALTVPPDDPDAMAHAVHRVLTEPGLAEKLSSNARQKAEQFDWSRILPLWKELFGSVARATS